MEDLRKEHAMVPDAKGGANRLRMMCTYYANEEEKRQNSDWVKYQASSIVVRVRSYSS